MQPLSRENRPQLHYADASIPDPPVLSFWIALIVWGIGAATLSILLLVVPRFDQIFRDFKTDMPAVTKLLLVIARGCAQSYIWIPALAVIVLLPFGLTRLCWFDRPEPAIARRRQRRICAAMLFIGLMGAMLFVAGLLAPMVSLIQTVSGPSGKK